VNRVRLDNFFRRKNRQGNSHVQSGERKGGRPSSRSKFNRNTEIMNGDSKSSDAQWPAAGEGGGDSGASIVSSSRRHDGGGDPRATIVSNSRVFEARGDDAPAHGQSEPIKRPPKKEWKARTEVFSPGVTPTGSVAGVLVGIDGPSKGRAWVIFEGDNLLGRTELGLETSYVSEKHAVIVHNQGKFLVRHLSETNPTLVNGENVDPHVFLKDGDRLKLCDAEFVFRSI
jgi:hypothetical protein